MLLSLHRTSKVLSSHVCCHRVAHGWSTNGAAAGIASGAARQAVVTWLEKVGSGRAVTTYRLRCVLVELTLPARQS